MTVHDPICTESGNLEAALYGSFLPIPAADLFAEIDIAEYAPEKMPGAIIAKKDTKIVINKGRERVKLRVTNNGDRPIQVCTSRVSHYKTCVLTFCIHRSVPITISSRQIPRCPSIEVRLMGNDSISLPELRSVSNRAT